MKNWIKGAALVSGSLAVTQIVLKKASKRSMRSQIVEWIIASQQTFPNYADYETKCKFVNDLYEANASQYELPKMFKPKSKVEQYQIDEMQVFKYDGNTKSRTGILYLHGGAYIYQPSIYHHRFIDEVAQTVGAKVEVPIYPKAPNEIFVRAYELIIDLYRRMIDEYDEVLIIGDSAGGGLAVGLMQLLKEHDIKQPLHAILLSPWVDINMDNAQITEALQERDPMLTVESLKFAGDLWSGHTDKKHHLLSPTYGDLQDLPPMTIFVGTREILLPDIRLFNKKLQSFNNNIAYHEFMNQNHVFPIYPINEAKEAKNIIYKTIKKYQNI
nr:alpha/beta hydrolase [Mammaliicoccus sp. Marseille-Q6498]